MTTLAVFVLTTTATILACVLTAGCVSVETRANADMRARAETAEQRVDQQQLWNEGCQQDNSQLQNTVIELERQLHEHEQFDIGMAMECAKIRKGREI